jgi:putative nicotinate phosphoribosyltransferase
VLGIPGTGTMAHAQVMTFGEDHEQEVFEMVMQDAPEDHVLLVDTYDTRRGMKRAIEASLNLGIPLNGVRDDSDLVKSIPIMRDLLDGAAASEPKLFRDTYIVASNDLDEWKMDELQDVPVDSYGVGTMLGTSADAPHLGGVYKLTYQYEREPHDVMKLTRGKQTDPGVHQVWRCYSEDGSAMYDVLALEHELLAAISRVRRYGGNFKPLLKKVMEAGRVIQPQPSLDDSATLHRMEKVKMPAAMLRHDNPVEWHLFRTPDLWKARSDLGDVDAKEALARIEQENR